jgi:hypothetical protein
MPSRPANQLRLMLHIGAYWLMWSLQRLMPARSSWRVAQFDTLRLLKLAARVVAVLQHRLGADRGEVWCIFDNTAEGAAI